MENIYTAELRDEGDYRRARVGERAGAEHLGLTVYQLAPGQGMHFHYHLQREELMVVLEGTVAVRTAGGGRTCPKARSLPSHAANAECMGTRTVATGLCACSCSASRTRRT